ncbi:winged helix-turn-helix domain-containing protein [Thaumasiovibrio sp. DFM-14]|uniref:winged helix-turn-helix domain-containing protein n=1 Tax=Thaumasiovibrio sp. DFM-14 TaxID=3384792 RepID=UPI0039A30D2F
MRSNSDKLLIGKRFLFDPSDNSLIDQHDGHELIRLGTNESRALQLLTEEPGAIITRQHLHNYVWRQQGFEVDDSSITQAISTLRKALKDSTKSPEFIKTIPKRGYQIIADVEPYVHQEISELSQTQVESSKTTLSNVESSEHENGTIVTTNATPQTKEEARKHFSYFLSIVALLIACTAPYMAYKATPPISTSFTHVFDIDGVAVLSPSGHSPLKPWQELIIQCIENYIDTHNDERRPTKVIATDGRNHQIFLNYIHHPDHSRENVTIRLLPQQKDNTTLCQ